MNAISAVDKLKPNELLLAENVRLDETGNAQVTGAFTHQNTAAYVSTATASNIHSLYWNPSLGGVAGIGQDVFQASSLNSMTSALGGANANSQKMSFATAPNKVFFDVGNVGYFSDMTNLLTVDWAPPSAVSAVIGGPNIAGTGVASTGWTNPNNVTSTTSYALDGEIGKPLTCSTFSFSLNTALPMQGIKTTFNVQAVVSGTSTRNHTHVNAYLMVGGLSVGLQHSYIVPNVKQGTNTTVATLGSPNDLWGVTSLTAAQVNSSSFGIIFTVTSYDSNVTSVSINDVVITAYEQGSGFVASTGAAGTLTGTYTWKITFVSANGEESDGSVDSTAVVLSAQQGTITAIPSGDARTTSRNIYRKGGALTAHYLVGSIPDNTTTTFSDNQTDIATLAEGVILAGDVPGDFPNSRLDNQQVRFPQYHYDRVFWVVPGTNQIIWSKPLNGFAYPSVNFFNVGDSKPISRIISIFGELIIIKTDSIWRLTGTDESSFDLSQTPSSVGTDESFSVIALPDKIVFANRFNLWAFNGYTSVPLTNKLDTWFKQLDRTGVSLFGTNGFHPIEVVSGSVTQNFDACGNAEKYYLSYAESGQAQNNSVLVFDIKHGNITKRPVTALSLAIDPVTGYVYMGDASGFVSLLDDWNGAKAGSASVNLDLQTGYQNFQRGSNQAFWALEFYINTNGQAVTPFVYYDGGENGEQLSAITTSSMQRVVRTLQATNARKAQNISIRLNASVATANVSGTPQIILNSIKPYFQVYTGRARTGQ